MWAKVHLKGKKKAVQKKGRDREWLLMKMDIVSSVISLTFTAAKDQLHSDTK